MIPILIRISKYTRIDKINQCWIWIGYKDKDGYGKIKIKDKMYRIPRLMYEIFRDKIPKDLVIDHLCRNRACINPYHMEIVTTQENTKRGNSGIHQRMKNYCPKGHKYSGNNLYINNGKRYCKKCHYENRKLRQKR